MPELRTARENARLESVSGQAAGSGLRFRCLREQFLHSPPCENGSCIRHQICARTVLYCEMCENSGAQKLHLRIFGKFGCLRERFSRARTVLACENAPAFRMPCELCLPS